MSTARPLRTAGNYRLDAKASDALREALRADPNGTARPSSGPLSYGGFAVYGSCEDETSVAHYATNAELAYVRWLDIAGCIGAPLAALLADGLRSRGYGALCLPPAAWHEPPAAVVSLIGEHAARDLAQGLIGRVYLVPHAATWNAETARAIRADIEREGEHCASWTYQPASAELTEWTPCAERKTLFGATTEATFAGETDTTP